MEADRVRLTRASAVVVVAVAAETERSRVPQSRGLATDALHHLDEDAAVRNQWLVVERRKVAPVRIALRFGAVPRGAQRTVDPRVHCVSTRD